MAASSMDGGATYGRGAGAFVIILFLSADIWNMRRSQMIQRLQKNRFTGTTLTL